MRLVVQRVIKAKVNVRGKTVGKIDKGLFVLVGVAEGDTEKDAENLAEKLAKLRILADEKGKMNLSIKDLPAGRQAVGRKILAVSQFTLYGDTSKGNRPSFIKAAEPGLAEKIYNHFVEKLKELDVKVETGKFGEYMEIEAELDGPVTLLLESSKENSRS